MTSRGPERQQGQRHRTVAHDLDESGGRRAGKALDDDVQRRFEHAYHHDFSHVRVHHDADAERATKAAGAAALAWGENLLFAPGVYQPETAAGQYVLAHELAHVVQRDRFGPVNPDAAASSHPGDSAERDADRAASAALGGRAPVVEAAPVANAPAFLGGLWDVLSGQSDPNDEPSFGKDVAGRSLWGALTDDTIGGLTDIAALRNVGGIGGGMRGVADPVSKVLGPLGVLSGGIDMYTGITGERNFENNEKVALGGGNVLSGLASTAGLFGVGGGLTGSTAMTAAGLAEAGAATGAVGGTLGAGLAAGGQVLGAGMAGYGAGKLMDAGVGWLGGATSGDTRSLTDRMVDRAMGTNEFFDDLTGSDTVGDIVGGMHLAGETIVSPLVAGAEALGDVGSWIYNGLFDTPTAADLKRMKGMPGFGHMLD